MLQKIPQKGEEQEPQSLCRSLFSDNKTLPLITPQERRTVFLDLDETLIHSETNPPPGKYDFKVRPLIEGERVDFYVSKRPYVDEFLQILSKNFEIVVFTAAIEAYASLVLNRLDPTRLISHRLYRDACKEVDGKFVKDLSEMARELKSVVIVDDNPNSYELQPENAILIKPYTGDPGDGELRQLIEFFEGSIEFEDLRDAVKHYKGEGSKKLEAEA